MKKALEKILKILSKKTLKTYKPKVIGITGSVGKTSVKEATRIAIGKERNVRVAKKSYNSQIGLPLTILDQDNQWKSKLGWLKIIIKSAKLSLGFNHDYPEWLVLEYGADRKGDINYLTEIARPAIAAVTKIGVAHAENFGTIEDVQEEKGALIRALTQDGTTILNADDNRVLGMKHMAQGPVVTYGLSSTADVTAKNIQLTTINDGSITPGETVARLNFDISAGDSGQEHVEITNVIGDQHVSAILAGATIALQMGIPLANIAKNLKNYKPAPGRFNLIPGIKRTIIMDDSYNASPDAVHAALESLSSFPIQNGSKRIAVIGDMLELGRYSEKAHIEVGAHIAKLPIDFLITVGENSRDIARGALSAGMAQNIVFTYAKSEDAGRFLQDRMKEGDVILVKGSQGIRAEKIVKEVMAEPLRAKDLLVRQEEEWKTR